MYWNSIAITDIDFTIRLTLTWDVLKFGTSQTPLPIFLMININMRCIEIILLAFCAIISTRLTLTWDVLK